MAYCVARGMRFYYVEAGEGPPLVLLHPAPLDSTVWLYQVPIFAEHFRVVALDQRGFGRSEKPEMPFAIEEFRDDLEAVLDVLELPAPHVVGLSIGGIAAQMLAVHRPGRMNRMVLVGTAADTASAPFIQARRAGFSGPDAAGFARRVVASLFGTRFRETDLGGYLTEVFADRAAKLPVASLLRFYEALERYDITDRLNTIAIPTLVIAGSEDVTYELSRRVAERIPNATFVGFEGYGRAVPLEAPVAFNRLVLDFLLSQSAGA